MANQQAEFHKQIESQLATTLLARNVQLPQIPQCVGKILEADATNVVYRLLRDIDQDPNHSRFEQLCNRASVVLPPVNPNKTKTHTKTQRQKTHEQHKANMHADAAQFSLKPDFFINEDKTARNILQSFSPTSTGVLLATAHLVTQWLQVMKMPVADELAILMLGHADIPESFPHQVVTAPAVDLHGREVILQGTLVQFGERKISTAIQEKPPVTTNETIVVAVTAWQSDHEPTTWQQIIASPVKTIQGLLEAEGFHNLMMKPWGRHYQKDGKTSEPSQATSVQFHSEFALNPRFYTLLRRSGFCRIFLQPKTESGQIDDRWKVAWLGKSPNLAEIESKLANVTGLAGLVKTRRGLGVRIEAPHFPRVWDLLFSNTPPPEMSTMKYLFKLSPLPFGVDSAVLTSWAQAQHQWKVKPLRPVGAKQWIVASNEIPQGIISFNSAPLLVQQLPQKMAKPQNTIAAGPRPKALPVNPKVDDRLKPFRQGDPHADPWMPYLKTASETASSSKPSAPSEPRTLTGPISDRLNQQDSTLQEFRSTVQQMKQVQGEQFQQLAKQQAGLEEQVKQNQQQQQQQMDWLRQEQTSLHGTVQEAMKQHEHKLTQTFEDLKTLITANRGTKRGPAKPDKEDHEDMESEGIL